jgi:hypothetical protein
MACLASSGATPSKMKEVVKYVLLILLTLPFIALFTDMLGRSDGRMVKVVVRVAAISWLLAVLVGGLHQRPNVANVFMVAFLAWPVLLLFAKGYNPDVSWTSICCSVPIMSWYLVNVSMQFYYPTQGGGGGLGAGLALFAGWIYMVIPFALLCGVFLGGRAIVRRFRGAAFVGTGL